MASKLSVCIDGPTFAGEAFARAAVLAARTSPELPAVFYAAPLDGDALALGAYQHAPHALSPAAFARGPVLRRASGGATVQAGSGIAYVALCLHEPSALVACPPGKLLNRYVRGLLSGLRAVHVPAYYFGRDFVSANADPCGYVGFHQDMRDRVQLEAFLAVERSFALPLELSGYAEPSEPRFRGKPLTTVATVLGRSIEPQTLIDAIAEGYARMANAERSNVQLSAADIAAAEHDAHDLSVRANEADELVWSLPREEAIGFVTAGVALDSGGKLAALELGGDVMQSEGALARLRAALIGKRPEAEHLGGALDAAYGSPGSLEGVRSLRTLQAALLDAIERAHRAATQ